MPGYGNLAVIFGISVLVDVNTTLCSRRDDPPVFGKYCMYGLSPWVSTFSVCHWLGKSVAFSCEIGGISVMLV